MRPYDRGRRDFKIGNITNPYHKNSKDSRDWEYGFNKAYFVNLEKVKISEEKRLSRRSKEVH